MKCFDRKPQRMGFRWNSYYRKWGLSDDPKFFHRTPYVQSTRKKSCVGLLHENWHSSLFTLQFPMKYYQIVTYGTDHWYASAYHYTIPVHPHISKWVLSGAGMRLHLCFPAAPEGIDRSELLSILSAIVYDCLWLFPTLCCYLLSSAIIVSCLLLSYANIVLSLSASVCSYPVWSALI